MTKSQPALKLAMTVHAELSRAIGPATPDTIRASSVLKNPALIAIALLGLLGFVLLVAGSLLAQPTSVTTLASMERESSASPTPTRSPPEAVKPALSKKTNKEAGTDRASAAKTKSQVLAEVFIHLSGALLGAAFYSFWTAREYLRDGTFNKQYSQVYLIRFGLGVVAGFVLASVFDDSNLFGATAEKIGPFTVSVVGGFSADAFVQILQRIADILVATVRGSDSERAKADADRITAKKLNETASKLQEALLEDDPKKIEKSVQKIVQSLLKR